MTARSLVKVLSLTIGCLVLVACGGGGGDGGGGGTPDADALPSSAARYAYVANPNDASVSIYAVEATTGQLRAAGYVRVSGGTPTSVTVDSAGRFAYVTVDGAGSGFVSVFSINPATGALTAGPLTATTNGMPRSLAFHPSGQFAYVSIQVNDSISAFDDVSAFRIDATTGALTSLGAVSTGGNFTGAVAVDPMGRFVYVGNRSPGSGSISAFRIDAATGVLTSVPGSPFSTTGTNGVAVDPSGSFVYVTNGGAGAVVHIAIFRIDAATGALAPIPGSPFGVAGNVSPGAIRFDPSGRFAYVVVLASRRILVFERDGSTGALTPVSGSPFTVEDEATGTLSGIAIDATGRFVYVTKFNSHKIFTLEANPATGALTQVATAVTRDHSGSVAIVNGAAPVRHNPKFAYVANAGSTDISGYRVNAANGALSALADIDAASVGNQATMQTGQTSLRAVAVDPNNLFAYAVGASGVSAFTINDNSGALTPVAPTPFPAGTNPLAIGIEPSARFVYVANSGSNNVSAFRINALSGALTNIAGSPFAAGTFPASVTIHPNGRFAYVTNLNTGGAPGNVSAFRIDPVTGALTSVAGSPFTAGLDPRIIVIDSSGRFAYVMNIDSNDISAFHIRDSGALVPVTGSPFGGLSSPRGITIEPTGRFLYVTNRGANNISAFAINSVSGALTPVAGSPFAVGDNPFAITTDPAGRFLYLTDTSASDISVFAIDGTNGALTPVDADGGTAGTQPTIPAGVTPVSIAIPNYRE
jgi:6-phosphogluconolactonase (cycloisomerase 2 family)